MQPTDGAGPVVRKHLVVARWKEDISWLTKLPVGFDVSVYQSINSSEPHFVENVGNEAFKYISYIIDNYHSLPETVVFVQAGRQDFHDPLPKEVLLQKFDFGAAESHGGFTFLPGTGTCWSVEMSKDWTDESTEQCINVRLSSPEELEVVRNLWTHVLEPELGVAPPHWRTACCAEFEVTREAITRHPLSFWLHLADWISQHDEQLFQTSLLEVGATPTGNHDPLERDAGHVMELVWPLLFTNRSEAYEWMAPSV